jgi:hypothetical protein
MLEAHVPGNPHVPHSASWSLVGLSLVVVLVDIYEDISVDVDVYVQFTCICK